MQPKQSKWSKRSRFLDVIDVSCVFLCFFFMISSSLESLAVFLGAAIMDGDVPSLGVDMLKFPQKMPPIFHASKCSSCERQKTKGCGPNGLGGLSKRKTSSELKQKLSQKYAVMIGEKYGSGSGRINPSQYNLTACSHIFPFLTLGWVVFHITVCLYHASVLHLAVTSWNSTARQQMTAG